MAADYREMSGEELRAEYGRQRAAYEGFLQKKLSLNISRGVPSKAQLDLAQEVLTCLETPEDCFDEGVDTRSYGLVEGLPSARRLFAGILDVPEASVVVGGNSSLNMMYDSIVRSFCFGIGGEKPWSAQGRVKFLCVVPGYDRHFAISERFGMEMIPVPMGAGGPDMERVREHVKDPAVKGIWCVPKYSNPDGVTYCDETVRALAALKPAAADFRIYWDNAYGIHDLYEEGEPLLNIYKAAMEAGNGNHVLIFASTSKISFPGAGVACICAGPEDIAEVKRQIAIQTICPDKTNQLRHVRYFKDADGLRAHMKKHAAILRPKFEAVDRALSEETAGLGFVSFSRPRGGYFISLDVLPGTAARTVTLAKEAGVALTPAGSTWPYKKDPEDKNIRIAPTCPEKEEIELAARLLGVCLKVAALEKLLAEG